MIPHDPQILASFVNTQLRDTYSDLDDLCKGLQIDKEKLIKKLRDIEYEYDEVKKRFV